MSIPECLLDQEEGLCEGCGLSFDGVGRLCTECRLDTTDMYADWAIQEAKEGR